MTANVSIIIAHRDDTLKLANAALRFRPPESAETPPTRAQSGGSRPPSGGWAGKKREHNPQRNVYVLGAEGKPRAVQIKTGITDGIATEVLEGLKEADNVIISSTAKSVAQQPQTPFGPGFPRRF
jgi:HlyD family secretion protein